MQLKIRFPQRGYSRQNIERAYYRAKNTDRASLRIPQKWKQTDQKVHYITSFISGGISGGFFINSGLYWTLTQICRTIFLTNHNWRPKEPKLLEKFWFIAIKSHRDSPGPKWGSRPCGDCSICKNMMNVEHFEDSSVQVQFNIVHPINCKTFYYMPLSLAIYRNDDQRITD